MSGPYRVNARSVQMGDRAYIYTAHGRTAGVIVAADCAAQCAGALLFLVAVKCANGRTYWRTVDEVEVRTDDPIDIFARAIAQLVLNSARG